MCCLGHLVHRATEGEVVRFGRPRETAQLPDELEEDARISSSVAGGLKLCRVLMFRHIGTPRRDLTDRALSCAPPVYHDGTPGGQPALLPPHLPPAGCQPWQAPGRRRVSCSALGSGRSQGSGNISRAAEISFAHGLLLQAWVNSSHSVNVPSPGERWR